MSQFPPPPQFPPEREHREREEQPKLQFRQHVSNTVRKSGNPNTFLNELEAARDPGNQEDSLQHCQAEEDLKSAKCLGPNPLLLGYRCPYCWQTMNRRLKSTSKLIDRTRRKLSLGLNETTDEDEKEWEFVPIPTLKLLTTWTDMVDGLMCNLYYTARTIYGAPPCKFALCVCGSLARTEACPWSDIDAFILLETRNQANRKYFQMASAYVESHLRYAGNCEGSPAGLSFCCGGLNPMNADMVQTPERMVQLSQTWKRMGNHEADVSVNSRFVYGNRNLHVRFLQLLAEQERRTVSEEDRQRAALATLRQLVERPGLPDRDSLRVDIKEELYRKVQAIGRELAKYYGLEEMSTQGQIHALHQSDHMSKEVADYFTGTLASVSRLRISSHLKAMGENHTYHIQHPEEEERAAPGFLSTEKQVGTIEQIINRIQVLLNMTKTFIQEKERSRSLLHPFKTNPFKTGKITDYQVERFQFRR